MSNFDFIRLPKDLIQDKYKDKIKFRGNIVVPERMKKISFNYYDWIKWLGIKDNEKNYNSWRMNTNSNTIWRGFIDPLIKDTYKTMFVWECAGGEKGGCEIYTYVDESYEYIYFYTMNRWKRCGAFGDYKLAKSYRIIIYRIPYSVYKMLYEQDLYETYLHQLPTGFRFKIMTHKQCLENKIKYLKMNITKNKEIKWN